MVLVKEDQWSPVIITLECGHEVDWRGPMTPGAGFAQVCMDCPVDGRGAHPWRLATGMEGYPSRPVTSGLPSAAGRRT